LQFNLAFSLPPVSQLPQSDTHRKYPHLSVVLLLKSNVALVAGAGFEPTTFGL
jgi:hypothetical protein